MYTTIHASCSSRSRTVQAESTNSRPGGACLMTSLTKNASASALESALAKSLDLKSPEMNSYKKPGGGPLPLALRFFLLPFSFCPSLFPSPPALLSTSLTEILHSHAFPRRFSATGWRRRIPHSLLGGRV